MKITLPLAFALLSAAVAVAQTPPATKGKGGRGGGPPGPSLASQILTQADKNSDQKLSHEELLALADAWSDVLDPDRTGRVTQEEFLPRFEAMLSAQAGGGRRGGRGGIPPAGDSIGFFTAADSNQDGVVARAELKGNFDAWFTAWDTDKNGLLDLGEITRGLNAIMPRTNMSGTTGREAMEPIPGLPTPPPSPVLTAQESMATVQLVDGFKLELAASEPMIQDPIAMSFDEDGRAYVIEMIGFMLDIDRSGEREPICRISRLEDTDGDGRFDKSTVFVDKLILPRAVAAMGGGLFYTSDYQLYFARDTDGDGKADRIELVDAEYGRGNVEHAPNGLFRAMDNWIYNGESPTRYRLINGTLVRQTTEVRGQWGMTQDNYGRLLYNVNNSQLMGDFTPPNYMLRNAHHPTSAGLNLFVATDQRAFPVRMSTAINRGYSPEVLDVKTGRAFVFASACAPMVYRGDNWPADFVGSVFVADPALNLIKRNLVFDRGLTLGSKFAYDDREFLAATDERFRPSNLYNGPDGALWVVDLYRGIAQYGQFMTAYLRRETLARGLDKGIHYGRIYRIVSTAKKPGAFPKFSQESPAALVGRLTDTNGWIRDTAQRLLIERGDRSVVPALVQLIGDRNQPIGRLHALWTLEGLFVPAPPAGSVSADRMISVVNAAQDTHLAAADVPPNVLGACIQATRDADPKMRIAAMRVAEALTSSHPMNQVILRTALEARVDDEAPEVVFQTALTAGNLAKPDALPLLARIGSRTSDQLLMRDAILTGLQDWELQYLQVLLATPEWETQRPGRAALLQSLASAVIKEGQPAKIDVLLSFTANQTAAWRRRSLLDGIASNVQARPAKPIAFAAQPVGFTALETSKDDVIREQAAKIKGLFAWPGHQSDVTAKAETRALTASETTLVAEGKLLFQQLCAGCHGLTGQGMTPMAPPLVNSDWVLGTETRLVRIALHGASGPINVNGTRYEPPNILPEMPALAVLDDNQLAGVLSFIRQAWGHQATPISAAQISAIRSATQGQQRPWTEAELLQAK